MNLVIDDAVEIKLATKNEEESRRELGMLRSATWSISDRVRASADERM